MSIGIVIDTFGTSRNIWYGIMEKEDANTFEWLYKNHLQTALRPPEVLETDCDAAIKKIAPVIFPSTFHIICLYHLEGNVSQHLQPALGVDWDEFVPVFWSVYRAVSPKIFETSWARMLKQFSAAAPYLAESLYPIHH